jgi:hypothetical protein
MFVPDAVMDMKSLRQGDILQGIAYPRVPLFDFKSMPVLGKIDGGIDQPAPQLSVLSHDHRGDPHWFTSLIPMRLSFCCVISHCCDLEPSERVKLKVPTFSLARLIPIPDGALRNQEKLTSLRANGDPRNTAVPTYIDFFHVPAHERLDGREWVIDFHQVLSLPAGAFPVVLERKILQIEDRYRAQFKIKLAYSLGRLTKEEEKAGLQNPWG